MPQKVAGPYQLVGEAGKCKELSAAFYARVERDSILRPLFPGTSLRCARDAFAAFLAQFLGGPAHDAEFRWWLSLRESHARFKIGARERDAWMKHMVEALDDIDLDSPVREALRSLFERGSAYLVNAEAAPQVAVGRCTNPFHKEIDQRWNVQLALDEAVAAIREHDAAGVIALAEGHTLQTGFRVNRPVQSALLAQMIASGDAVLANYAQTRLREDPALSREHYSGRTLLHAASAAGNLGIVELLLRLGADPNTGRHPPLYCVGNECKAQSGGDVVRALVRSGALVDACDNVKRCTALHMAARRDHVEVVKALLECGADMEARDSLGDTPLRRAVNCGQRAVAALLISSGADATSVGSRGLTPRSAARTSTMKQLFEAISSSR